MPLDATLFRAALSRFASGVTVVTTRDANGVDHGMTATSFASVSLEPPLILVCVDHTATMANAIMVAEYFAVHILAEGQAGVSSAFARREATDKFVGRTLSRGSGSIPLLHDALAQLECRVHARHPAGDHTVVIGEVIGCTLGEESEAPLLYFRSTYGRFVG
jgi:flavin reductase (DIM6/NTAB) family NADH-FMN oxidoreductase RutF